MKDVSEPAIETAWENPLIPNKRLRQLYASMAELRLLESRIAGRRKSIQGEEACRVATALSLLPGDLTSDSSAGIATAFLRGAKLEDLSADTKKQGQLPVTEDATARLYIAVGAALAARKKGPLVLAYIYTGDLALSAWKPVLRLAAANVAPVLLVVLPSTDHVAKPGALSDASSACGLPGITVDAADAVALYRVAQESMLRIRAGGGPVLMECIPFQLPGKKSPPADPVLNMRASLVHRKLADDAWFKSVEARFIARLKATGL